MSSIYGQGSSAGGGVLASLTQALNNPDNQQTIANTATGANILSTIAQGESQAGVHNYNAELLKQNAKLAQASANVMKSQNDERTRRLLGTQKAMIAQSGLSFEGSPLFLLGETAAQNALENSFVQHDADSQKQGFQHQASIQRKGARNARRSSYVNAAGTLLTAQMTPF